MGQATKMITFKTFSFTKNITRRIWEFGDDKIKIHTKSLNSEFDIEIKYEEIKFVETKLIRNSDWAWIAFMLLSGFYIIRLFLRSFSLYQPTSLIPEKIVVTIALFLFIPIFWKKETYSFLDINKYILTTFSASKNNRNILLNAIDLVRKKASLIEEIHFSDPLPIAPPIHELSEYNFPDYIKKNVLRFYDDKVIIKRTSLVEERTLVIEYDEITSNKKFKSVNRAWGNIWSYWLIFVFTLSSLLTAWFPQFVHGNVLLAQILLGCLALLIPLFLLGYLKQEYLGYFDKDDVLVLWTRINNKNQEKVEQIAEFIKGKITI